MALLEAPGPEPSLLHQVRAALHDEAEEAVRRHHAGNHLAVYDIFRAVPELLLVPRFHEEILETFGTILATPPLLRSNRSAAAGTFSLTDAFFDYVACEDTPAEVLDCLSERYDERRFRDEADFESWLIEVLDDDHRFCIPELLGARAESRRQYMLEAVP